MTFLLKILTLLLLNTVVYAYLKVATYNLWNVMFNWDVRKLRISQMIRETAADIVTFQEVRQHESGRNQMHDIQQLLPWFKYQTYAVAHAVAQKPNSYKLEWGDEGIGLISQHPIVSSNIQRLIYHEGIDTNHRLVLHVTIKHPVLGEILVSVVHLSYDRLQQCDNIIQIMDYLAGSILEKKIIIGDFNAYSNFDYPVKLLTDSKDYNAVTKCESANHIGSTMFKDVLGNFQDAWLASSPGDDGLTFSNMPEPGLESRPDRIYITKNLEVLKTTVYGDGKVYKEKFYGHILWSRTSNLISAMSDTAAGKEGRSCLHDCGPHASCRCGVCVSGGDKSACLLPNCEECQSSAHTTLWICLTIAIFLLLQLIYSVLKVLQTMNDRSHKSCINSAFCDWFCLCDLKLFSNMSNSSHRSKRNRYLHKLCPQCRLPPMILVFLTFCLWVIYIQLFLTMFSGAVHDIYAIIPEELFPSDHLMLTVTVKVSS